MRFMGSIFVDPGVLRYGVLPQPAPAPHFAAAQPAGEEESVDSDKFLRNRFLGLQRFRGCCPERRWRGGVLRVEFPLQVFLERQQLHKVTSPIPSTASKESGVREMLQPRPSSAKDSARQTDVRIPPPVLSTLSKESLCTRRFHFGPEARDD